MPKPASRLAIKAVRSVSAILGTVAWSYSWFAVHQLSSKESFLLWASGLLLWAAALFSRWQLPRWSHHTTWALVIIALGLLPRALWLSDAPYNVTLDEASYPYYGLQLFAQRPWEIVSGGHEGYLTYFGEALQTWPCVFLGPLVGGRAASVVLALLSLWSTYALGARLFGRVAALVALLLLSGSYWHIVYARMAYPYMQPLMALPLTLWVLLMGIDTRNRFLQFLGGVLLGMSISLYTPARIVIPVFAVWCAHRLATRALHWREALRVGAVAALGAVLFVSPFLRAQGVARVFDRYGGAAMSPDAPLRVMREHGWTSPQARTLLAKQVQAATSVYIRSGAWIAVHDYSPVPLLDPVCLALALGGLGLALLRWRDHRAFLLVIWIAATFVSGQVLTDVPIAAYRAAPLLPALTLCVALLWHTTVERIAHRSGRHAGWINALLLVAVAVAIMPTNVRAVRAYVAARARSPWVGMARLIGAGGPEPIYYVVSSQALTGWEVFRFLADGRTIRDVPSLVDALGRTIDASRPAVFVLDPSMANATTAIRRCYPAALWWSGPYPPGPQPVLALYVPAEAVAAGRNCEASAEGPGLRARYYRGAHWDGDVVLERVEDWPVCWITQAEAAQFGSVEWDGWLRVPVSGTYRFQLQAKPAEATASVGAQMQLAAGESGQTVLSPGNYSMRLRCTVKPGSSCWLRWAAPMSGFDIIPPQFLRPATAQDSAR